MSRRLSWHILQQCAPLTCNVYCSFFFKFYDVYIIIFDWKIAYKTPFECFLIHVSIQTVLTTMFIDRRSSGNGAVYHNYISTSIFGVERKHCKKKKNRLSFAFRYRKIFVFQCTHNTLSCNNNGDRCINSSYNRSECISVGQFW